MNRVLIVFIIGIVSLSSQSESYVDSSLLGETKTEIQINSFSEVPAGLSIKLGDIAVEIKKGDIAFSEIEEIDVFTSRAGGEKYFLSRHEVARALENKVSTKEFKFKIPNQIIITAKNNLISYRLVAKEIIKKAIESCQCQVSLRDLRLPRIESEQLMQNWSLDFSNINLKGNFLVPMKVVFQDRTLDNNKEISQTFWVTGQTDLSKQAYVARKALKPGEQININDFELKPINVTYLKGSPLNESEFSELVAAKYISSGQTLLIEDTKKELAAKKGQVIKVLAGTEELEVTMQATAEESGIVGDLIKIKNFESQRMMTGKLIEKGVVRLQ